MDAALVRHDALITAAVTEHGGIVLKHKGEGDSTFSVFDERVSGGRRGHRGTAPVEP